MHTHTHTLHISFCICLFVYTRHVQYYLLCTWHSRTHTHIHSAHVSHTKYISFIHPTNMSLTLIKYLRKFHVCFMFSCMCIYIYTPGQSLSRMCFDLCGFSAAGLTITFGLRVMDSMTQFWCQKVGLSRLFCVILHYICGSSKCDWQMAKSAIVRFLVAHYFSVKTKKTCSFWMSRYIYKHLYIYIFNLIPL